MESIGEIITMILIFIAIVVICCAINRLFHRK